MTDGANHLSEAPLDVTVVIFSFNRGPYLENAVASVQRHWPSAAIKVMDDFSDDRATVMTLRRLRATGIPVLTPPGSPESGKRGGLQTNMQTVWDHHVDSRFVLFMSDDMQLVRRVDAFDEGHLKEYFAAQNSSPVIFVTFMNQVFLDFRAERDHPISPQQLSSDMSRFDPDLRAFRFESSGEGGLWDHRAACSAGWRFGRSEHETSQLHREKLGAVYFTAFPFLAFLPAPESYRNRRQGLVRKVYFFFRAGLFPIDDFTPEKIDRLRESLGRPPYAHDFLSSSAYGAPPPWPTLPLDDAPDWVRRLDRLEQKATFWSRIIARFPARLATRIRPPAQS